MKKLIALLALAAICLCVAGCVDKPEESEPAGETQTPGTSAPTEETAQTTAPSETQGSTQGTIQVPTPDDMPDAPTADYTLPGNERPGDRITDTQKS